MLGLFSSQPNHSWILLDYGKIGIIRQRPVNGFDSASSFAIGNIQQLLMLFLLDSEFLDCVNSAKFSYPLC